MLDELLGQSGEAPAGEGNVTDESGQQVIQTEDASGGATQVEAPQATEDGKPTDKKYQTLYQKEHETNKKLRDQMATLIAKVGEGDPSWAFQSTQAKPTGTVEAGADLDETQKLLKAIREEAKAGAQEARLQDYLFQEKRNARSVLTEIKANYGITDQQIQQAMDVAQNDYGFNVETPGGWTRLVKATIKELANASAQSQVIGADLNHQQAIAQKVKAAQLVAQPVPGASPQPVKLTKDEKALEDMSKVGNPQEVHERLFA